MAASSPQKAWSYRPAALERFQQGNGKKRPLRELLKQRKQNMLRWSSKSSPPQTTTTSDTPSPHEDENPLSTTSNTPKRGEKEDLDDLGREKEEIEKQLTHAQKRVKQLETEMKEMKETESLLKTQVKEMQMKVVQEESMRRILQDYYASEGDGDGGGNNKTVNLLLFVQILVWLFVLVIVGTHLYILPSKSSFLL